MIGRLLSALVILGAVGAPTLATAQHPCGEPPVIVAAADGTFSFQISLTVGVGGLSFGSSQHYPVTNVEMAGLVADGFCLGTSPEGTVFAQTVEGTLQIPQISGTVHASIFGCLPDGGSVGCGGEYTVLPFGTVTVEKESFGMVKGRFGG